MCRKTIVYMSVVLHMCVGLLLHTHGATECHVWSSGEWRVRKASGERERRVASENSEWRVRMASRE